MEEGGDDGWESIRTAVVDYACGELTAVAAHARISSVAERCGLSLDRRVARLLERLGESARKQQDRRESYHRLNNAIAGVRANVDYLALALEHETALSPFLVDATPRERANVLQALHYAIESSQKLVAVTEAALGGGAA